MDGRDKITRDLPWPDRAFPQPGVKAPTYRPCLPEQSVARQSEAVPQASGLLCGPAIHIEIGHGDVAGLI